MKIELLVDGRKIPMNEFVQTIVGNVIKAMVETLHTIDGNWKEISIHIEQVELHIYVLSELWGSSTGIFYHILSELWSS